MEIRAIEGETISVPADDGEVIYLAIQNQHAMGLGEEGAVLFSLGRLSFGNRRELEGEVWRGKRKSRLVVERAHGN